MPHLLSTQGIVSCHIGLWLAVQGQRLRDIDPGWVPVLAVDQPVQQVQDMGLGGNTCFQRQLDSTEHRLLVMVQDQRSEEHTSELQSLMRISYAVFCLKKKKQQNNSKNHVI